MDDKKLERLEKLAKNATPGPWTYNDGSIEVLDGLVCGRDHVVLYII